MVCDCTSHFFLSFFLSHGGSLPTAPHRQRMLGHDISQHDCAQRTKWSTVGFTLLGFTASRSP